MEDSIRLWIAVAPPQLEELRTLQRISPDIYTSRIDLSATQMYWRKFRKVSSVGMDFFFLKNMMGKEGCFIGSSIRWLSMSQFVNVLIETKAWVSCRLVYFRSLGSAVWVVAKWWKVRFECVQSVIGTFQYFDAVMLQECGMQSCGISILNETKQTKRNKQMKHKQFWVFLCNALCFAVRFLFVSLSVGECSFCENDLLKGSCKTTETGSFPEHLHACQSIWFWVCAAYSRECTVNSRELVLTCFRDGDCSGVL